MFRLLFLFLLIFLPIIKIGGYELYILKFIPIIGILAFIKTNTSFLLRYMRWTLFLVFLLIFHIIFLDSSDFFIIKKIVIGISFACISYYIVYDLYKGKNLLIDLSIVTSVNSLITILSIISPFFSNITESLFAIQEFNNENIAILYRFFGLSSYGGAVLSTVYAMGVVFALLYFQKPKKERHNITDIFIAFSVALNLAGIVFSGRTGFIILLIFFIFLSISKNLFSKFRNAILLLFVFFGLLNLAGKISNNSDSSFYLALNRTLEGLRNYNETGNFRTSSSDALIDMFFLPDNEKILLIGNAKFSREIVKIKSDIFYVRIIYYAGIFFLPLFIYTFYDLFMKKQIKYDGIEISKFIFTSFILINFKEFFYLGISGLTQCFFILYFLSLRQFHNNLVDEK